MQNWSQDLYIKGYMFAAEAHWKTGRSMKGRALPYFSHVDLVVMEVMAAAGELENPDFAVLCALLHDTIEDTEIRYKDIEKNFGKSVAALGGK